MDKTMIDSKTLANALIAHSDELADVYGRPKSSTIGLALKMQFVSHKQQLGDFLEKLIRGES